MPDSTERKTKPRKSSGDPSGDPPSIWDQIFEKLNEIFTIAQASDRAIRGHNGEVGLNSRVKTIEGYIEEIKEDKKTRDKENRTFWKSAILLGVGQFIAFLASVILWLIHVAH